MNLKMGSHIFSSVDIPLLWGKRAVIQDKQNRISIIDLGGRNARIEVLADAPAPGISFEPTFSGFKILENRLALYLYDPKEKRLENINLGLPDCEITPSGIRIGSNYFANNVIFGSPVGFAVTPQGIAIGASLPADLAQLIV